MKAPHAQGSGDLFDRMISTVTFPEEFTEADRFTKLAWINRRRNQFTTPIHRRFPKSMVVNARHVEHYQIEEYPRKISVTVPSVATNNHTTFGINNIDRPMIQENDVFYVQGLYAAATYTTLFNGSVTSGNLAVPPRQLDPNGDRPDAVFYSRNYGPMPLMSNVFFQSYDQIKVINVGSLDSAGVGHTQITVQRFYCGPHGGDLGGMYVGHGFQALINAGVTRDNGAISASGNDGRIAADDFVLRALPIFPEGSDSPYGRTRNPERRMDFTQEFKYAIEWTEESEGHKQKIAESQLQIAEKISQMIMTDDYEKAAILGRKGRNNPQIGGKLEMAMGGVWEHIPRDDAHQLTLDAGTMNYASFLDFTLKLGNIGGSTTWDMYVGPATYNAFKKSYYNDGHMWFNHNETNKFDIPVETIIGSGITVNIIPVRIMEEIGFSNFGILMDREYPIITPITYKDWDMKVDSDAANKGTTMKKKVYTGIKGFARRYDNFTACLRLTNI